MSWLNEQKNAWTAPFTRVLFDPLAKEAQQAGRGEEQQEERRTQQLQTQRRRRRWWKSLAISSLVSQLGELVVAARC